MTNAEAFLKHVPLFKSMRFEDVQRIVGLLRGQFFKKGDVLFRKGDEGYALYVIITGKIKIVRHSRHGDEVILAVLSSGDFLGEMALLDGLPRSADAVAIEETQVYALNRKDFMSLLIHHETVLRAVIASLSQRLRKADDFLEDTCFLNISARLAKKIFELAERHGGQENRTTDIELRLTQKELASMIGATRESVNKELRILREKGLLSTSASTVLIHDLELLKKRIH